MTVQIKDSIKPHEGEETRYAINRFSENRPFRFSDYFERPFIFFTACWRGHVAHYKIINNELILDRLRIFKEIEKAPMINGVQPEYIEFSESKIPVYKNIGMKMNYTGRIMVKSGHLNLGLRPIFQDVQIEKIIEYKFASGQLEQEEDLSWLTEKFRQEMVEYALEHCDTQEMKNKLLGHAVRNEKNLSVVQEIMRRAKGLIIKGRLFELTKDFKYPLFEGFKLKNREFHKEFNKRLYHNYGLTGFDW